MIGRDALRIAEQFGHFRERASAFVVERAPSTPERVRGEVRRATRPASARDRHAQIRVRDAGEVAFLAKGDGRDQRGQPEGSKIKRPGGCRAACMGGANHGLRAALVAGLALVAQQPGSRATAAPALVARLPFVAELPWRLVGESRARSGEREEGT
jgi:hypothetical protein